MSYSHEENPRLVRYQKARAELQNAQAGCATAAKLYVDEPIRSDTWITFLDLKAYVDDLAAAEVEFNDAESCYRHPERAHERG